ncbi:MAG: glycosyltransferase family protein [Bacteroidota bacterium]
MKKRFLYAAEVFLPGEKASSIHVMRMCEALAGEGYDVTLLALRSPNFKSNQAVFDHYGTRESFELKVVNAPGKGRLASFFLGLVAMMWILRTRPTLTYTRSVVLAFLMSLVANNVGYEAHTFVLRSVHKWHVQLFRRLIKKPSFRGMIVISGALKKMFVSEGLPGEDVFVAHDGADVVATGEKLELKGEYSCNAGYFGSTYKGKGVEVIVKIARHLPDVGFHVFGGTAGNMEDEGVMPSNLLFYGFVSPAKVHLYRNACDVLLAPYQENVFVSGKQAFSISSFMSPLKIFEYMSAQKPMIVSDLPVLREILSEQTALIVSPADVEEWSEGLEMLCNNQDKREQLAANAYKQFLDNHTWQQRAASIKGWLEQRMEKSI